MMRRRASPAALASWTAVFCVAFTVGVTALPFVRFAYRAPALHVALETADAIIGLLVAFLIYGRFRQSARRQEMLLVLGLCSVAVANLVLTALPSAVSIGHGEEVDPWAALAIRLIGTVLIAAAAFTSPDRSMRRPHAWSAMGALTVLVVLIGVLGDEFANRLPPPVDVAQPPADTTVPALVSHPAVLGAQGLGAVLYALAAVAFTRQSARTGDQLMRWVGAGCVLAAAARVHYVLFPSLYSQYVYTGDALRLGSYLFMLVGAAREIRSYWELRARTAVLEDRRRVARDLHDGLAQELAFIAAHAKRLSARHDDVDAAERIVAAAVRAQDEARRAIRALSRRPDMPFAEMLEQSLDDLAGRYEAKIVTNLDHQVQLHPGRAETVLRIVGEAVRNAIRHGHADRIEVDLTGEPLRLTVSDNGNGFALDSAGGAGGGFGLTSMRERAASLGARLEITSSPGDGTTVRVVWQ